MSASAGSCVLSGICTANTPPCGSTCEQTPQHRGMVGDPLQHGVGEQEIDARLRAPMREIRFEEAAAGKPLARLAQHVGRGIEADHFGLRIALDQQLGGVAGPAAEIDHPARRRKRHLRQEIARRARALVLELEVLARTPVVGHRQDFRQG